MVPSQEPFSAVAIATTMADWEIKEAAFDRARPEWEKGRSRVTLGTIQSNNANPLSLVKAMLLLVAGIMIGGASTHGRYE